MAHVIQASCGPNGISQQVVDSSLNGVVFDPSVAAHDRGQNFGSNFAAFSARHVTPARIKKGKMMMLAYAEPLQRIEQRYGVPGAVVVAIWGLETDFGAGLGGYSMFSALATLAYDCRRAQIYRAELIDALMLVQRGLLRPIAEGRVGRRDRTDPVHAVGLSEICGQRSRGRRRRHHFQSRRRAGVDSEFPALEGLEPRCGLGRRPAEFQRLLQWNSAPVYAKTLGLFADKLAEK